MGATNVQERTKLKFKWGGVQMTRTIRYSLILFVGFAGGIFLAPSAWALDIGVSAKKLIVIDKLAAAGKAKAVFVAKDVAIDKGAGTDPDAINVNVDMVYENLPFEPSESGSFFVPAGASDGTAGWVANKDKVAKYVNKSAPAGPTAAKVAVIKPGKLLKIVAKERGDADTFDILGAGSPPGDVQTSYCVQNGFQEFCHCTEFSGCIYKVIAGGTGAKLVCKGGVANPGCDALCLPSGEECNNDGECCSGLCLFAFPDVCVLI